MNFLPMILLLAVSACGYSAKDTGLAADGQPYDKNEKAAALSEKLDSVAVDGYISPIDIDVDGQSYSDGEDFYTAELSRLEGVVAKEYPGFGMDFEAAVGLRDLKRGMSVYLVSQNDGFSGESKVDGSGKFSFYIPNEYADDTYTLRAYKRIGLRLNPPEGSGKTPTYWCYNMYAERVGTVGKSVVLREFTTKVTRYQC